MDKKILVPLDGSELAEAALPYAEELALKLSMDIELLRVVTMVIYTEPIGVDYTPELEAVAESSARLYLDKVSDRLKENGINVKSELGIEIIDAHSHFFTASLRTRVLTKSGKLARTLLGDRVPNTHTRQRLMTRTNIESIEFPWDLAQRWINELDRYGISAIGFMIGRRDLTSF